MRVCWLCWPQDGIAAQQHIDDVLPDVILLDWMLPGQSGVELASVVGVLTHAPRPFPF